MAAGQRIVLFLIVFFSWSPETLQEGDPEVTECELTTGRTLTVIKSAGFPGRYGSNVDCRYTVRRRSVEVCSVTFLFNVMDLEQSENCTKDYLLLQGERVCGSKPIGFSKTVSFTEEEVTMTFHSDNETTGLGYMVTVVQQDCPQQNCDSINDVADFTISSPNYPLPYDNGRTCKYTVHKSEPAICKLLMKVRSFDLEDDEHCASDFLQVNNDKLCGVMTAGQIVEVPFSNDTIIMEFQSDHVTTRDGFQIDVHQSACETSSSHSSTTQAVEDKFSKTIQTTTPTKTQNSTFTKMQNNTEIV